MIEEKPKIKMSAKEIDAIVRATKEHLLGELEEDFNLSDYEGFALNRYLKEPHHHWGWEY